MNRHNKNINIIILIISIVFFIFALKYCPDWHIYSFILTFFLLFICIVLSFLYLFLSSNRLFMVLLLIFSLNALPAFYPIDFQISGWSDGWWMLWVFFIRFNLILSFLYWTGTFLVLYLVKKYPKQENKIYKKLYIFYWLSIFIPISYFIYYLTL